MLDLSWLEGILFSSQSTQMLIGAQQWSLTDFLEAWWHFPSVFVTWISSLLQPTLKSVKEEKGKEQNSCWTPAVHLSHLHPTAVTAIASPKHMRCSCIYAQYIYQKQRNKKPGRNCTNSCNKRHPHQFSPVLWLSPSLHSVRLHQADRAGSSSSHRAPYPSTPSICTGNMKLQPEFKQKHFWSISQTITKVRIPSSMAFTKGQSHEAFTVVP